MNFKPNAVNTCSDIRNQKRKGNIQRDKNVKKKSYKKTVVIQNKSNLLLEIFLQTYLHYNY